MNVIILHPTEELIFAKLQKELISELFCKERLLYAVKPLWINFDSENELPSPHSVKSVELGDFTADETEIFVTITINTDTTSIKSKLTLVRIYKGNNFSAAERDTVSQKKQPVRLLKIFRLGQVQDEGPHAKSISKSVWCKCVRPLTAGVK